VGNRVLSLNGILVLVKEENHPTKDGDTKNLVAKITGYDTTNNCIYTGKMKGKQCPGNNCPAFDF
jgi:hypothetical protein